MVQYKKAPSTLDYHREYWNLDKNTKGYEKNNFSVLDDPKAKKLILRHLDKVLCDYDYLVADIGCGPGKLLPYLSGKCREVVKMDYAEKMLEEAERRNSDLTNIKYRWGDMRDLAKWYEKFDVVIATNAILPGSIDDAERMMREIYRSLKEGGKFIAVMPSMETCNYLARLKYHEYRHGKHSISERRAAGKVRKEFRDERKYDGILGFTRDGPNNLVQKYFYYDELEFMLTSMLRDVFGEDGFKIKAIKKIRYTWEHCKIYGYGYYPKKKEIYDWIVIAEKSKKKAGRKRRIRGDAHAR